VKLLNLQQLSIFLVFSTLILSLVCFVSYQFLKMFIIMHAVSTNLSSDFYDWFAIIDGFSVLYLCLFISTLFISTVFVLNCFYSIFINNACISDMRY